uniref:Uncharacterized protein n=1 Tax=Glossina austeni TaxID=7395 RepID=A0A1A9V7L4_GLOAU
MSACFGTPFKFGSVQVSGFPNKDSDFAERNVRKAHLLNKVPVQVIDHVNDPSVHVSEMRVVVVGCWLLVVGCCRYGDDVSGDRDGGGCGGDDRVPYVYYVCYSYERDENDRLEQKNKKSNCDRFCRIQDRITTTRFAAAIADNKKNRIKNQKKKKKKKSEKAMMRYIHNKKNRIKNQKKKKKKKSEKAMMRYIHVKINLQNSPIIKTKELKELDKEFINEEKLKVKPKLFSNTLKILPLVMHSVKIVNERNNHNNMRRADNRNILAFVRMLRGVLCPSLVLIRKASADIQLLYSSKAYLRQTYRGMERRNECIALYAAREVCRRTEANKIHKGMNTEKNWQRERRKIRDNDDKMINEEIN